MRKDYCIICTHQNLEDIHDLLLSGTSIHSIPAMFDNSFTRQTLIKHVRECLGKTSIQLRQQGKITSIIDVDNKYNDLTEKALEALESAREVLLVDGQLNLHPRSWEIQVVYVHPYLKTEDGKPLTLTDSLDNVLALLGDNGIKVKKSMLKAEDPRKTYRSAILAYKEILENYFRLFGAYKQEQSSFDDELDHIRKTIEYAAKKGNISYRESLEFFIDAYSERTRRDLLEALKKELATLPKIINPLPPGMPQKEVSELGGESAIISPSKTD